MSDKLSFMAWGEKPQYSVTLDVTAKEYRTGRPDTLTIEGTDNQGTLHVLTAYGKNADRLNRFVNVHNRYRFDMGKNDYDQMTIKGVHRV